MSTSPDNLRQPKRDANNRPFNLDLSPWGGTHEDAKRVPADSFMLPGNAVLRETDRYRISSWGRTGQSGSVVHTCQTQSSFPYIRLIADDPELYTRMRVYAENGLVCAPAEPVDQTVDLATELAAARAKVAELEAKQAEDAAAIRFKVGDYVTVVQATANSDSLSEGRTHRVTGLLSGLGRQMLRLDGNDTGWYSTRFRSASEAEIKAYVAEYEAIKVGDWVVVTDPPRHHLRTDRPYEVEYAASVGTGTPHIRVKGDNVAWAASSFRKATAAEIAAEKARQDEEVKQVMVKVDGAPYISKYRPGYVEFGCAHICNNMIRQLQQDMCATGYARSNRAITAVQIGKGLFTREQIATLASNLVD